MMLKAFVLTSLQLSFHLALSGIAMDLREDQRDHFKLLCAGGDSNSGIDGVQCGTDGELGSNGFLRFMYQLEDRSEISRNKTGLVKIVLEHIGRRDLVEEKIYVYEFQREFLNIMGCYGSLLSSGGGDRSDENQPAMRAAQKLWEYVTGNHDLDAVEHFAQKSTDEMFAMLECYRGRLCWPVAATTVILAAEMICRATKSELEDYLIWTITDRITRFLWPWMSRNGSWVSV